MRKDYSVFYINNRKSKQKTRFVRDDRQSMIIKKERHEHVPFKVRKMEVLRDEEIEFLKYYLRCKQIVLIELVLKTFGERIQEKLNTVEREGVVKIIDDMIYWAV